MENLNNTNTWAELKTQCPHAFENFKEWWTKFSLDNKCNYVIDAYPYEMQMGIVISFLNHHALLNSKLVKSCYSIQKFKIFMLDQFRALEILVKP